MAAEKIKEIVVAACAADPDNKDGLRLKAVGALLKAGLASADIVAAAKELDPKNEKGLLELVVQSQFQTVTDQPTAEAALVALNGMDSTPFKDKKVGFALYFTAARWCAGPLKNPEATVKYAERALACGTEDEKQTEFLKDLIAKSKASAEDAEADDSDDAEDSDQEDEDDADEEEDEEDDEEEDDEPAQG
jgi:cobalamin biosynthesis protein CobT